MAAIQAAGSIAPLGPRGIPGNIPGGMPGGMPGIIPGGMPGIIPGIMPGIIPGIIPGGMPGIVPGCVSGFCTSAGVKAAIQLLIISMNSGSAAVAAIWSRQRS